MPVDATTPMVFPLTPAIAATNTTTAGVRVRTWLADAALPLWARLGVDRDRGGFVERLMLDGRPDLAATKRVRVQARQIYVYAHASLMGLYPDALAVARQGWRFLADHALPRGVDGGFVHALQPDGQVADDRRDTYDHAFLLFALSWLFRAGNDPEVGAMLRPLAESTWRLLRHPGGDGLLVDDCGSLELHQNPHMHLFEAVLAAHEATGDPWFLDRADELFDLFRRRMFDSVYGVLREFHDAHWQPLTGDAGKIVEPGHHCEWVWLLKRYADRRGQPLCEEAWRLFDFAERHGRLNHGILLCDQLDTDGHVLKRSTRSWPQTEAIKADVAMAEARSLPLGERADVIVAALFDRFLDPAPAGGWIDWLDADGQPVVQTIPASTFYHLFLAFSEYLAALEVRT